MASDYNHVTNRNMNDFFTSKQYKGDIYKTTNLRNQALAQYCDTDSALVKEQQRIETELVQFERNLYGSDLIAAEKAAAEKTAAAETAAAEATAKVAGKTSNNVKNTKTETTAARTNSKKKRQSNSVKQSNSSSRSSSSNTPKASVRRERR